MSDAGLIVAAVVGLALTAGAILRDTRRRLGAARRSGMMGTIMSDGPVSH